MAQYFDNVEELRHKRHLYEFEFMGEKYSLMSDEGIFSKNGLDDGTRYLLESVVSTDLGKKILDLGCGAGPIGLILAHLDPEKSITMSDVNLRALQLAKENAERMGLLSQVEIVTSDVYLNLFSTYDTILSNPPIRAGKKVTYAIYDGAKEHLNEGGSLIVVVRKKQGADSVFAHLKTLFPRVDILKKKKGYVVMRAYR